MIPEEKPSPFRYFAYDPNDCCQLFKTKEEAIEFCKKALETYHEECYDDGWDEDVELLCWGEIKEIATICDVEPWPNDDNDEDFEPPFEYSCNYKMKPPKQE